MSMRLLFSRIPLPAPHPRGPAADGSGYAFMADSVLKVDKINAQVGAEAVLPPWAAPWLR